MQIRGQSEFAFLNGGGAAAEKIRAIDWTGHELGPMPDWPDALKIALGMMLYSRFPKALAWGPSRTTFYNDAFRPILGDKPEAMGQPFDQVWAEAWDQIGPIADRAMAGEATFIEDFPLVIDRHGYPEACNFTFCFSPVPDGQGEVLGMIDTVIETTGKVEAERQMAILNAELAHRIKNTLAIIGGIARQTLRAAATPEAAWAVFSDRLGALARTHEVLTGGPASDARIDDIVRGALSPHVGADPRVTLDGPPIRLNEKRALALSLAINELATNAMKYGALSVPEGQVSIRWKSARGEGGALEWTESGGPPVAPPDRRSFGTVLLEQVVPQDFGGTGTLSFEPAGLTYRLTAAPA